VRRALHAAVFLALLATAACASSPPGEDEDPNDRRFAIVVHGVGESANSASYNVSIANVSSDSFDIRSVSIVPVQQLPLYPQPYTTPFVLEPGQERGLLTELRTLRGTATEWPDEVYVDVTFIRHGGKGTESHRQRLFVVR
jgi:hypothetical protein